MQLGDLLDLDGRAELDLVAGDGRAAGEAGDLRVDENWSSTPVIASIIASLALLRVFGAGPVGSRSLGGSV